MSQPPMSEQNGNRCATRGRSNLRFRVERVRPAVTARWDRWGCCEKAGPARKARSAQTEQENARRRVLGASTNRDRPVADPERETPLAREGERGKASLSR